MKGTAIQIRLNRAGHHGADTEPAPDRLDDVVERVEFDDDIRREARRCEDTIDDRTDRVGRARHDPGERREILQRGIGRNFPATRIHENHRLDQHLRADDLLVVGARRRDRQLDAAGHEQFVKRGTALLAYLQMHLRMLSADFLDDREREARNHRRRHADAHGAGERQHFLMHGVAQFVVLTKDRLSACVENATGRGRRHARHGSVEQLDLELLFQHGHLLAECGLSHTRHGGSARDTAAVHDLNEVPQTSTVHC